MKLFRLRPNVVISEGVSNQSTRDAVPTNLIVLHSTESHNRPGNADLAAIVGWFDNPEAEASAHVIVDADGNSARCVGDGSKAWSCRDYNSASLNIEQIGFASQGGRVWRHNWKELRETARWIAQWSLHFHIPIRRGIAEGGGVVRSGIVTHKQLGLFGGGHVDPGGYPVKRVLTLARLYKTARRGK